MNLSCSGYKVPVIGKVEEISTLRLVCPLLSTFSLERESSGERGRKECECCSKVELLLTFAAVVQEAILMGAWFVCSLGQDCCLLGRFLAEAVTQARGMLQAV